MKLLRSEHIALLLVGELAVSYGKHIVSLTQVAALHGVSPLYLKKIASLLKGAGIIKSKEGVGGGYALTESPKSLTVGQIIHAIRKEPILNDKMRERVNCPLLPNCLPQHIDRVIEDNIHAHLEKVTVSELIPTYV